MTRITQSLAPQTTQPVHKRRSSRAAPGEKFDDYIIRRKHEIEQKNKTMSIWRSPVLVLAYFGMYTFYELQSVCGYFYRHTHLSVGILVSLLLSIALYCFQGPHQVAVQLIEQQTRWYGYWLLLGVASAIGLGTGLHTFLLFLGPYIAEVTMAAYACNGTESLTRNQSYRLQCVSPAELTTIDNISLWSIYWLICWESFAWGAGTALGELPPYFIARAVALSGGKSEELGAFEAGLNKKPKDRDLKESISHHLYNGIQRLGFFGILLFASIPNPLFDLAGITCGHFLVPFTTFFGATFVGKACVKASMQSMIVILAFSRDTLSIFLNMLEKHIPSLHTVVKDLIHDQAHKFGKDQPDTPAEEQIDMLGIAWNAFLSLMICYFVISSIESLGLSYMKRKHKEEMKRLELERDQD
ncbi:hypothetical protein CLU79DRAFT_762317 [Phycomyces nitens]|nr:hypothetical protein CLU79DRAFT_762317 [Phycomyces nitens]